MPVNDAHPPDVPLAPWPDAPRYCPHRSFPPYRFVSGLTPHPINDPEGHSYGKTESVEIFRPEQWRKNEEYLYGIDLYHQGYFWESHEAWEGLWRVLPREDIQSQFLQGLIKNSAAQIKANAGAARGVCTLSRGAHELLGSVEREGGESRFMGVDVGDVVRQMERHYGGIWRMGPNGALKLNDRPPRLELA